MFRSLSIISAITLVSAVFPFLLLPLMTRLVSVEDYGNLIILETFMVIVTPFIHFSVAGVVVEFFKLKPEDFNKYIASSMLLAIPAFLGFEFVLFFLGGYFAEKFSVNEVWLYFLPIFVLFNLAIQTLISIYQCQKNYKYYSFFLLGPSLSTFSLTLVFLIIFELGWQSKLYATGISFLFFSILAINILNKRSCLTTKIEKFYASLNLKFTIPIIPHTIAASLYFVADRIFLSDLLGNAAVAIYAAGMQLALVMSVLQNSVSKAWNPFVLEFLDGIDEKNDSLLKAYIKLAKYMLCGCLAITILSVMLIILIYFSAAYILPESYEESKYLGMMLVGAFCILGFYKIVSPILWFHKHSASLSKITFVVFCINLLLNTVLIPKFGVYGACYATILSISCQFFFTSYLVYNITVEHINRTSCANEKRI